MDGCYYYYYATTTVRRAIVLFVSILFLLLLAVGVTIFITQSTTVSISKSLRLDEYDYVGDYDTDPILGSSGGDHAGRTIYSN